MAGLSLQTGFRAYAAAPPSASATSITQQAYGPASGASTDSPTPYYGTVISGLIGLGLLAWLWWSLPR